MADTPRIFDVKVPKGHGLVKVEVLVYTLPRVEAGGGRERMLITPFETPFAPAEINFPDELTFTLRLVEADRQGK